MRKFLFQFLIGLVVFPAVAADVPLKPNDFAYGLPLATDGRDGVYKVNLPFDVYRIIRYADLRDVRVFNGDGELVPHVVTRSASSVAVKSEAIEVPRFPVYAAAQSKLGDLSLEIKRDTQGTVINLKNVTGVAGQNQVVGYILDANKVVPAIKAIELQWSESIASYAGSVTLEASDDLKNWKPLAQNFPITRMKFGEHLLEQRLVSFSATPLIYLRISWPVTEASLPELVRVMAIPADANAEVKRTWQLIKAQPVTNKADEYEFDVGAQVPIDRLRFHLPQNNTLIQTELLARVASKDPWQSVTNATLYRIEQNGRKFLSDDLQINRDSRRHWLLRVAQQGGGLGSDVPNLQVGWLPDQVMFLARGRGPFQLAYGAVGVKSGESSIANLTNKTDGTGGIEAKPITSGAPVSLGGEARLSAAPDPFPWKKWLLWGILGLGVLSMAWMASRLMNQMNHTEK